MTRPKFMVLGASWTVPSVRVIVAVTVLVVSVLDVAVTVAEGGSGIVAGAR